jgi:hypothetical protein
MLPIAYHYVVLLHGCQHNKLQINKPNITVLSRVLVTKDGGSWLDERVYLLVIRTTSNYT